MIGQTILHYTILEKLGEGGMGVVYKARDTKLDRDVALKFLPLHLSATDQDRARFLQEAQTAATLNHPNVCVIYSIDESDGQQFIVMEYIDGEDLKTRARAGRMSAEQIADIALRIAEGLRVAHERGIVHRDIKSDNVML